MDKNITFGEIRKYVSWIDRVSICMVRTGSYSNYGSIKEVPESFDEYYLYGIGVIENEFNEEENNQEENQEQMYSACMEIVLSEKPRSDL